MRRTLSVLVLLALAAGMSLPFASAQSGTRHACCARNGKHHCLAGMNPSAPGWRSAKTACPYDLQFATIAPSPAMIRDGAHVLIAAACAAKIHPATVYLAVGNNFGSVQKRGPPIL